jgi:hypothetical protein
MNDFVGDRVLQWLSPDKEERAKKIAGFSSKDREEIPGFFKSFLLRPLLDGSYCRPIRV